MSNTRRYSDYEYDQQKRQARKVSANFRRQRQQKYSRFQEKVE